MQFAIASWLLFCATLLYILKFVAIATFVTVCRSLVFFSLVDALRCDAPSLGNPDSMHVCHANVMVSLAVSHCLLFLIPRFDLVSGTAYEQHCIQTPEAPAIL